MKVRIKNISLRSDRCLIVPVKSARNLVLVDLVDWYVLKAFIEMRLHLLFDSIFAIVL